MAAGQAKVTYRGATPAGGLSHELLLTDPKSGETLLLVEDAPQVVDAKWVKLAEAAQYQKVDVESVAKDEA